MRRLDSNTQLLTMYKPTKDQMQVAGAKDQQGWTLLIPTAVVFALISAVYMAMQRKGQKHVA